MAASGAEIAAIEFRLFTVDELRKMSVMEVVTPNCFDVLDHPLDGGLYDAAMGPSGSFTDVCVTCKQVMRHCPGHFGRIELPVPVVNPLFEKEIYGLIRNSCRTCNKVPATPRHKYLLIYQLRLLSSGYVTEPQELTSVVAEEEGKMNAEANDAFVVAKIIEFAKERGITFEETKAWTKTMESLRRQFVDAYLRHVEGINVCPFCKNRLRKAVRYRQQLMLPGGRIEPGDKYRDGGRQAKKTGPSVILAGKARDLLRGLWIEESELIREVLPILKGTQEKYPTDLLFTTTILVTPPKTRPLNKVGAQMIENPQTRLYKDIVKNSIVMKNFVRVMKGESPEVIGPEFKAFVETVRGESLTGKFQNCWTELQSSVNALMSTGTKAPPGVAGLKQIIEKKEGVLRKHMMGKRVNFAARSVITPDPNLLIQEIGVPEYFAKKLSYPVKVNYMNVHELRKMVRNGPDVYPGANLVEVESGSVIRLSGGDKNKTKREGIAKLLLKSVETGGGKIVHRHVLNGDILLLNRQPTLHRPSIMAHRARVLKGEKTFRLHYSNCKSYNADFDGDEMNAHMPQTETARSEAYNLVGVRNNYLVPKDGTPLGGLIQDHVISGVRLTLRGRFFNKKDYFQLVYQGLGHARGDIKLLPPAILKPEVLWSGKQIISTILANVIPKGKELISLRAKAKIHPKSWETGAPRREWKCGKAFGDDLEMSESQVIIRKGQLLCGVLDKQHYGATPYGLAHCLYELYGGNCSSKFLDSAGKLFTAYLQFNAFTLGIKDILIDESRDRERSGIVARLRAIGDEVASKALELDHVPRDLESRLEKAYFDEGARFKARLDQEYKNALNSFTNDINKVCLPKGLVTKFPDNNLQLMVASGAKGSTVNTMQISCLLGQIELEGKRPPFMISGKSLPCYKPFETSPRAGGYIDARFMTGISPQDFFFHCMAGREGLIDTAVKTARSGYLQRCLIKHLEGVNVCYDGSVRDHDGSVVQFAYGEDGLEVQKATFLKAEHMDFLYANRNSIVDKSVLQVLKDSTDVKRIEKHRRRVKAWEEEEEGEEDGEGGRRREKRRPNGFALFSANIRDEISDKYWHRFDKGTGRSKASAKIIKKWRELDAESRKMYRCECPDPVASKFNRNRDLGVVSEKVEKLISDYVAGKSRKTEVAVRNMVNMKYISSLCQPGEAVGLLAAQSIGEPSTQMTLNTFHFAGRGDMNVTLGIPRLREILLTASKDIKTPYMDIPLRETSAEKAEKRGARLKKKFKMVTVADVLEKIEINEKLVTSPSVSFTYTTRFVFLPRKAYQRELNTNPKEILRYMEKDFLIALCKKLRKLGKRYGDLIYESKEEKKLGMDETRKEREDEEEVDNRSVDLDLGGKRTAAAAADEGSSGDERDDDDDDATAERMRLRRGDGQEYDDPDDPDDPGMADSDDDDDDDDEDEDDDDDDDDGPGEEEREEEGVGEAEEKVSETAGLSVEELVTYLQRQNFVLSTFPMVKSYSYDSAKEEWCEMVFGIPVTLSHINFSSILKETCESSTIYQVANVKRAILYKNPSGATSLKTEGINFVELFKYSKHLDLNKLYSNDVHEVARVYGIEAASRVIVNELKEVFAVYGIVVDPRHLLLIADFMTHQGYFSPFSRVGMAHSSSPLQQMSFESTVSYLKSALNWSKTDVLRSPSASIMLGKPCTVGTGAFDLINEGCFSKKAQTKEIPVCSVGGFE